MIDLNEGVKVPSVTIYTDGACSGNPGPGGWGAILIYKNDLETFNYTFEDFEQYEKNKKNTLSLEPYIKLSDKETRFVRYFKRFIKKKIYLIFKSKNF